MNSVGLFIPFNVGEEEYHRQKNVLRKRWLVKCCHIQKKTKKDMAEVFGPTIVPYLCVVPYTHFLCTVHVIFGIIDQANFLCVT